MMKRLLSRTSFDAESEEARLEKQPKHRQLLLAYPGNLRTLPLHPFDKILKSKATALNYLASKCFRESTKLRLKKNFFVLAIWNRIQANKRAETPEQARPVRPWPGLDFQIHKSSGLAKIRSGVPEEETYFQSFKSHSCSFFLCVLIFNTI